MSKKSEYILWGVGKRAFRCTILPQRCQNCGKVGTLVGLPAPILEEQPDETNVVCHPGLEGCNHGFHTDVKASMLFRELDPPKSRKGK